MQETVSQLIKIREFLNLSQSDLAQALGVSQNHLSMIENGNRNISKQIAKSLNEKFNISMEYALSGTGSITASETSVASEPQARYNTDTGIHPLLEQYRLLVDAQAKTIEHLNNVISNLTNSNS